VQEALMPWLQLTDLVSDLLTLVNMGTIIKI
jgi:hypothetical protein